MTLQRDALYSFAAAFYADEDPDTQVDNIKRFMVAYLQNGTIQRSKRKLRRVDETIFNNDFVGYFSSSMRAAIMPRDYIFATMSQFPWYHYPVAAASMTWSEIFMDLHEQATKSGNSFTARFTQSMIQLSLTLSQSEAWTPSTEQPEPKCLGDFLKLLGSEWEHSPPGPEKVIHLCSKARARSIDYDDSLPIQKILTMIENTIKLAPSVWSWSFQGGELSGKGSYPYAPDLTVKTMKMELATALENSAPIEKVIELAMRVPEAQEKQRVKEEEMLKIDDWVTTQCMRILSLWYRTMGITDDDAAAKREWNGFLFGYSDSWHTPVRETLVLMVAVISCQIPLSSLEWIRSRFIPVLVRFEDRTEVLGLLAKHAATGVQAGEENGKTVVVAGRHTSNFSRGTDLVLAGVTSRLPVGILPDFIHHFRQPPMEQWSRLKTLYGPLLVSEFSSPRQIYRHVALDVPAGPEANSTTGANTSGYLQIKARPHELQKFSKPTINELYHYRTLQQKGWFRVLVIEPSPDPDERISCSLLHRPLIHATSFEALSYTWGDEKAEYPILIDGGIFYVRRNLYSAIRELRPTSSSRTLWIDAICINQNDVSERGFQVAQMGDIYSLAERVVVWLGEGNGYSDLGFDAMAEYFQVSNAVCKAAAPGTDSSDTLAEGLAEFLALPNMDNCLFGITALYIRPWWRRMWTAQEIGLAREIEVQYGSRSITWEKLHLFATTMMLPPVQKVLGQYTPHSEIGRKTLKLLLAHITTRAQSMENTRRQLRKGKLNLSLLIRVTIERFATDPRDKIYGLLGMTNNDPVLQPDYTLSVAAVYTTATKAMLLQNRDLRVLSFLVDGDVDREQNLPSWVLDFKNLSEDRSFATLCGFVEDVCERIYSAAPIVGPDADFTSEFEDADRLLRLKGVALDIVRTIGDCTSCPGLAVDLAQLAPKLLLSTITQWKSCIASVDLPYVTGEASLVAFWKTVLTDKKVAGYHPGFSGMLNQASDMRLDKNDSSIPPSTLDEEMLLVRALASSSGLMSHLWSRRFAVSEKGYFTLLPGTVKTGDVLCILVGGEMPYVLRPLANGRFQMLGEWYDMFPPNTPAYNGLMLMRYSYVHGMMDGEIAEGVDKRAFTYQPFTLE
jgi:Heterokaryon incompatibility protein (HET)